MTCLAITQIKTEQLLQYREKGQRRWRDYSHSSERLCSLRKERRYLEKHYPGVRIINRDTFTSEHEIQ